MAIYGITDYSTDVYGFDFPPQYRVDPFTASSLDYASILLTWAQPSGTILAYRLLRNRFGYPADQDDGEILIDSTSYPGNSFIDHKVIPGEYHYYGFYVLLNFIGNVWVRSATTATLAINQYEFHDKLLHPLVPGQFTNETGLGDVFTVTEGSTINTPQGEILLADGENRAFHLFLNVISWGMNLLKTQYDTYLHLNNPWKIPLPDLHNLANQVGVVVNPDIHPYTLRKAVFFNAQINKERGTTSGLATEVSALTGWNLDLTVGQNFMLENDQSEFLDPDYPQWVNSINYNTGEKVSFSGFWYNCINASNIGNAPTGTSASNTWWAPILSTLDNTVLLNSATGFINTWEPLYPTVTNGITSGTAISEIIGIADPLSPSKFAWNGLQVTNNGGGTQNVWLRSIARTPGDIAVTTTTFAPNKYQVINDGLPVPYDSLPSQTWNATTTYETQNIVTYNNQPFVALRQSKNALPPYAVPANSSPEWAPLSLNTRFRICVSAYCTGSSGAIQIYPFVEWYDDQGTFIMRHIARNPTPGTVAVPDGLVYDSFTTRAGTTIDGTRTDDGGFTWIQEAGSLSCTAFATGSVYPTVPTTRSYAVVSSGVSDTQIGITFLTGAAPGMVQALYLRWLDDTHYIRASRSDLRTINGATHTTIGSYSTPCSDGDRLTVTLSGSNITCFRNGVQVLTTTSTFNQTATRHGFGVENT